ncbi:MAG: hypothetical protein HC859_14755 [Bacteroidia bacterium]|nr:hypothetical protein [Bacteroidia bacterium]
MSSVTNKGYDPTVIADYKAKSAANGLSYAMADDDDHTDEYAHFFFVGKYESREVVYDAAMYTLRLQHESELYEIAEHRAARHFPQYKKITYEEDENGNLEALDPLEEEIGLFMAEVIMELEDEGQIKVWEHVDMDVRAEFGISLDIGLHVEEITPAVIAKFVKDFNEDNLRLDETRYTFQTQDETVD